MQEIKKDKEKIHMLDINKDDVEMQEIKEEKLCKMEEGSHMIHTNRSAEPSQT